MRGRTSYGVPTGFLELNALGGSAVGIYRRKPTEVKAFQWWPGKEIPGVAYEEEYITEDLDGERRVRQRPYVVTAHGQRAYLAPGDWVLPEPDGRGFYPCKPEIFEATWELIGG